MQHFGPWEKTKTDLESHSDLYVPENVRLVNLVVGVE